MQFDEWEKGTGLNNREEFELAEKFYLAMPEGFSKQKLYDMRNSMDEQDFLYLCELVVDCDQMVKNAKDSYKRFMDKANFLDAMVDSLKTNGKIDCIATYAALESEKAKKREQELILGTWEELR